MGTNDGYQILEPKSLEGILSNPSQVAFSLAIQTWITVQFPAKFPQLSSQVSLHVIPVAYHGIYPALGLKYKPESTNDLSEAVEVAVDFIIETCTISQLLPFFAESSSDWSEAWQALKEQCKDTN